MTWITLWNYYSISVCHMLDRVKLSSFDVFRCEPQSFVCTSLVSSLIYDKWACSPIREFVCFCALLSHKEFNETFDLRKNVLKGCSFVAQSSMLMLGIYKFILAQFETWLRLILNREFFSASYKWIWNAWCLVSICTPFLRIAVREQLLGCF